MMRDSASRSLAALRSSLSPICFCAPLHSVLFREDCLGSLLPDYNTGGCVDSRRTASLALQLVE
jgi:hypothetical protein